MQDQTPQAFEFRAQSNLSDQTAEAFEFTAQSNLSNAHTCFKKNAAFVNKSDNTIQCQNHDMVKHLVDALGQLPNTRSRHNSTFGSLQKKLGKNGYK